MKQNKTKNENPLTSNERAELEALREAKIKSSHLSLKVSAKQAVSMYGLGRFPVTLYKGQWEKVISFIPQIKEFIRAHDGELSVKE